MPKFCFTLALLQCSCIHMSFRPFTGFSGRASDQNGGDPPRPSSGSRHLEIVQVADDDEVGDLARKDLENMKFVAYSWMVDEALQLPDDTLERIEQLMEDITISSTGPTDKMLKSAVLLNARWQLLRGEYAWVNKYTFCKLC